jgi:hypothetical protein
MERYFFSLDISLFLSPFALGTKLGHKILNLVTVIEVW